ncbi:MAG: hypothetical protein M1827_003883 [Pycnora praestabilis]|nr:MAG: hypothetical protein M1827_003883 [Pycnora praestabilis]
MAPSRTSSTAPKAKPSRSPGPPSPSSSIILISASNQVLLLHRVKNSTSFASAHVFPGGNLSASQDGNVPEIDDPTRHQDGPSYRLAAIRECFEESGILLARESSHAARGLLGIADEEREAGRKAVHQDQVKFQDWLRDRGAIADTENLIPFTRWITPTNILRRFTTQMYLYFLPLPRSGCSSTTAIGAEATAHETDIPIPTADGGLEHTTARFLPASTWLSMAKTGKIILFPPQFFLLHLISTFLSPDNVSNTMDSEKIARQRDALMDFINTDDPPWGEKCISPTALLWKMDDGRAVLGLEKPGPELARSERRGDPDRVVLVEFSKEGPRNVEVRRKKDVFAEQRAHETKL